MIKPHLRAVIAATALCHALGRKVDAVYQYGSDSGYKSVTIEIDGSSVKGYDYDRSAFFEGNVPSLYDFADGCHVEFKPQGGGKYSGFVFGAGGHFEVTVKGQSASFFDYSGGGWTEYSL